MLSNVLLVLGISELPAPSPALGFELLCVVSGWGWDVLGSTEELWINCGSQLFHLLICLP